MPSCVDVDVGERRVRVRRERGHATRRSSTSSTRAVRVAEVEAVEQREVARLGDDELAVGVGDVARELGAAARGVDADEHRAR